MLQKSLLHVISRRWRPAKKVLGAAALALCLVHGGTAGAQTLAVWDDYTYEAQSKVMEQLNQKFQAAHSGVTIQRTAAHLRRSRA